MKGALQAITLLGLVSSSCGGTDVVACQRLLEENTDSFGQGAVVVRFADSVQTEAEARQAVHDAAFQTLFFYSSSVPLRALVEVPRGGECLAIEHLRAQPAIDDASPQLIVHAL